MKVLQQEITRHKLFRRPYLAEYLTEDFKSTLIARDQTLTEYHMRYTDTMYYTGTFSGVDCARSHVTRLYNLLMR